MDFPAQSSIAEEVPLTASRIAPKILHESWWFEVELPAEKLDANSEVAKAPGGGQGRFLMMDCE
jgi:hypothetical protein